MIVNKFRKFLSGKTDGASAVEFAIVAPVFFFMVFSIIESSLFMLHRHSLRYIVFESTRDIQTGEIQRAATPAEAFKTAYCSHTPSFVDCNNIQFDVRAFNTLSSVTFQDPEFDDEGTATNFNFNPGRQEQVTMVTAAMRYQFNTPVLKDVFQPDGKPVLMVGYSIAKNEPFGCIDEC